MASGSFVGIYLIGFTAVRGFSANHLSCFNCFTNNLILVLLWINIYGYQFHVSGLVARLKNDRFAHSEFELSTPRQRPLFPLLSLLW